MREKFLRRSIKAANRAHTLFTEGDGCADAVVDQLWEMFNSTKTYVTKDGVIELSVSASERLKIAKFISEIVGQREQTLRALGLDDKRQTVQRADTILNVQVHADLPQAERIKRIEAFVSETPQVEAAEA